MFAKNNILFVLILIFSSCEKSKDLEVSMNKPTVMRLNEMQSGYESDTSSWQLFLSCWLNDYHRKDNQNGMPSFNESIVRGVADEKKLISLAEYQFEVENVEKKLAVSLPKSYTDFLLVYQPKETDYFEDRNGDKLGFLPIDQIKTLYEYDKPLLEMHTKIGFDSDDESYYKYGIAQYTASGRVSYFKNAIVIGKHGSSSYELILLYPNSLTKDGEMEAAIWSHAYEFRAPSFAELMRQLSVLETEDRDTMPPYSQDSIKNTCADKLKLDPIWWR